MKTKPFVILVATFSVFFGLATLMALLTEVKNVSAQSQGSAPTQAAPGPVTFAGGPGDSFKTAIIIQGAKNSLTGVEAEYRYLEQKFGQRHRDWKLIKQSLIHQGGKHYDLMEIQLADGVKKQLYFDITEFFGKF